MRGLFTTTLFCLLVVAVVNGASLRTSKASSSLKTEISELIKIKNQVKRLLPKNKEDILIEDHKEEVKKKTKKTTKKSKSSTKRPKSKKKETK